MVLSNHRIGKTHFRKFIAFLMTIIMLFSSLSFPIQAAIAITKDNMPVENQSILDALKQLYGEDVSAQDAQSELEQLGLLDKDGQPFVTATVEVDGEQFTLEQVRELVFSARVDLDKLVAVDGVTITLGDLKTMIEIEDEIKRIKDTYFSDVTLNKEQQEALDSLRMQIETEGIMMMSGAASPIVFPSGIDHSIYAEVTTTPLEINNGRGDQSVSVTLKDSSGETLAAVPDYDISISYRFIDGSAKQGVNYSAPDGTMTFSANSTETQQTIPFSITDDASRFEGQKTFVIQYYNPQKILLQGGRKAAETPVKILSSYQWHVIKQFASGSAHNRDDMYLNYVKNPWQVDYATLMASDMFSENLYDKVELSFAGTLTILDMGGAQTGGPTSLTPKITFGYPVAHLLDEFPNRSTGIANNKLPGNYPITYKEYILYDPLMLQYFHDAEVEIDYHEHGEFNLNFPAVAGLPSPNFCNINLTYTLSFFDSTAPTIQSITMPEGKTFEYGQSVPITVTYSEPANLSTATLTANGQILTAVESNSKSRLATFLYPV